MLSVAKHRGNIDAIRRPPELAAGAHKALGKHPKNERESEMKREL